MLMRLSMRMAVQRTMVPIVRWKSRLTSDEEVLELTEKKVGSLPHKVQKKVEQLKVLEQWREQSKRANELHNPRYKGLKGNKKPAGQDPSSKAKKDEKEEKVLTVAETLQTIKRKPSVIAASSTDNLSTRRQLKSVSIDPKIVHFIEDRQLGSRPYLRRSVHHDPQSKPKSASPSSLDPKSSSSLSSRSRPLSLVESYRPSLLSPIDKLFVTPRAKIYRICSIDSQFPEPLDPEIAFAGRSNVGKSSLINKFAGLRGHKAMLVSPKPGETQKLHFIKLPSLMLVDLPGYGFALAPEKRIEEWQRVTRQYVVSRGADVKRENMDESTPLPQSLKRVCVLIDSRHGLKPVDIEFLQFLDKSGVPNQVVLTKTDLIKPDELARRYSLTHKTLQDHVLSASGYRVVMTSSKTTAGVQDLRKELSPFAQKKSS